MDLFEAINKLFRNERIENPPSDFMLHRFLSSDPSFAPICRDIGQDVYDTEMIWEIWRNVLPKSPKAPFLPYTAPKKTKIDDPLVEGLMERVSYNRKEAEDVVELIDLLNIREEVSNYYGVENE